MTPADSPSPVRPDPLRRTLREVSGPAPAPAASARIADAAWARAAELRESREGPPRTGEIRTIAGLVRAAAAVLVAAAGALAGGAWLLRSSEPAFAVEGDPVHVRRGASWDDTRAVPLRAWVHVGPGTRAVVGPAGRIDPRPGTVFRIVEEPAATRRFRVEIRTGNADVRGDGFVVSVADRFDVRAETWEAESARLPDAGSVTVRDRTHRTRTPGAFAISISLGDGAGFPPPEIDPFAEPFADPGVAAPSRRTADAFADGFPVGERAVVRALEGSVRLLAREGTDTLRLSPADVAAEVAVPGRTPDALRLRLTRAVDVEMATVARLVLGGAEPVAFDARASGRATIVLRSPEGHDVAALVPPALRDEVGASFAELFVLHTREAGSGNRPAAQVRAFVRGAPPSAMNAPRIRQLEHVAGDVRTTVTLLGPGVLVETATGTEFFGDLPSFRTARPAVAALFGDSLDAAPR